MFKKLLWQRTKTSWIWHLFFFIILKKTGHRCFKQIRQDTNKQIGIERFFFLKLLNVLKCCATTADQFKSLFHTGNVSCHFQKLSLHIRTQSVLKLV